MLDSGTSDDANPAGVSKGMQKDALERLQFCRRQKIQFELDLREGYFFAAPHRARNVLSTVPTPEVKPKDAPELNSSFAFELCGDFPTVIMNTFMPEATPWAKRAPGILVPQAARQQVDKQIRDADKLIFEAIGASNFYEASGTAFEPDLALGTTAMWIDRESSASPICCQPIPIRELEIGVGPTGDIDDRFVVRWTRNRFINVLLKGVVLPGAIQTELDRDPGGRTDVRWGFWREWDEAPEVVWHHVVMVKGALVKHCLIRGDGSCPLVVGRINPSPEWSWGVGPLIKALPDLRYNDALTEGKVKNIDLNLQPPVTWPDDSFANIEEGLETGMAYAIRPGTADDVKKIYQAETTDVAIYATQDIEQRLRRLFYLDWPQQPGKTPPTASQWLDEMAQAQQRIGTPGRVFWREYCGGSFMRFAYLLTKDGLIQEVKVDGKHVALRAVNPAQLAAEQQEVSMFARFVQLAGAAAPEEFKIFTDGKKTIQNLARKMGADKIWAMRSDADVQTAIGQIQKLQQGQAPTAPQVPGAPAGQPVPPQISGPAPNQPIYEERGKTI